MACAHCSRRKLRCDEARPICGNCIRLRIECEYRLNRRPTSPRRSRRLKKNDAPEIREEEASDIYDENTNAHNEVDQGGKPTPASPQLPPRTSSDILDAVDTFALYCGQTETADAVRIDSTPDESDTPSTPFGHSPKDLLLDYEAFDSSHLDDDSLTVHNNSKISQSLGDGSLLDETARTELTTLFFREVYPNIPIIHESRYYAALRLAPDLQPPLCLRYAMWALAAVQNQRWSTHANGLYEKARLYLEQDESKGLGTDVLNVAHVQCWSLIATYESYMLLSLRTWSSIRRAAALAHVLRLHTVDDADESAAPLLPTTQDPSELEERRRAFWSAFSGDKWISSRTGYPMTMANTKITTKLPSSELSFNSGLLEETQSLDEALETGLDPHTSLFGARAVLACLLGRIMQHVGSASPSVKLGSSNQFWLQHDELDDLLVKFSRSRSATLRPTTSTLDPKLWAFDMWLHGLTICLHQIAVDRATKEGTSVKAVQSRSRCRVAADHIVQSIRSIAHIETRKMDPFTASTVYMAGTVLIRSHIHGDGRKTDIEDLRYLERVLELMHKHWKVTEIFITQFREDLAINGINLMITPNTDAASSSQKRVAYFDSPAYQRFYHGHDEEKQSTG